MRICMISEGSYPYVTGGVSSWINTLLHSYPEHEFIIYVISADSTKQGQYKYTIPENVVEIRDVHFDLIQLDTGRKGISFKMSKIHRDAVKELLRGRLENWNNLFSFFRDAPFKNVEEFFMSRDFFELVKEVYLLECPYTPFTEFVWTLRSMYLPLFYLLIQSMPRADIYHSASTGYAGIIGSYGKYLHGGRFILSEHGIYTREREEEIIKSAWVKGYYKDFWIRFFYGFSLCAYDAADLVTSLFARSRELQIELGCQEEKTAIIPNGVQLDAFENIPTKTEGEPLSIGAVVRVVPIKDIKTMLRAFDLVKRSIPEARFYIMGPAEEDEEYYQECLELMADLGLKDTVFTGPVNVPATIGRMDILVLTSISEGQPLAVIEGMAAGKPHVCTNVGDCRGLVLGTDDHYGQAGYVEHVMDYEGIASAIVRLAQAPELRHEMGRNGLERVRANYRKEMYINRYKEIYKAYEGDPHGGNRI